MNKKINLDEKLNNLTNIVHHQTFSNNLARFIIFVLEYLPAYSNIFFLLSVNKTNTKTQNIRRFLNSSRPIGLPVE